MNRNLFGEPVKLPSGKNTEIINKGNKLDQYDSLGLDKNKTAFEKGGLSKKFCPWCQIEDCEVGFSMCFINWIICKSCIDKGVEEFQNNSAFKRDNCMKCKSETNTYTSTGEGFQVGICLDCLKTGQRLLVSYEPNLNYKTGQYRIL